MFNHNLSAATIDLLPCVVISLLPSIPQRFSNSLPVLPKTVKSTNTF